MLSKRLSIHGLRIGLRALPNACRWGLGVWVCQEVDGCGGLSCIRHQKTPPTHQGVIKGWVGDEDTCIGGSVRDTGFLFFFLVKQGKV